MSVSRTERVAERIASSIASSLITRASDTRLNDVTVCEVVVTGDLQIAKVYWRTLLPVDERGQRVRQRALKSATPFLRKQVAKDVVLKFVPVLNFYYDESPDRARRLQRLLDEVVPAPEPQEVPEPDQSPDDTAS